MTAPRWEVQIVNPATGRPKVFNTHDTREAAEIEAAKLRAKKLFAQVRRCVGEEPEHRNDRRRFIVWGVLCGFAKPERLTEAIVSEIERETS